MSNTSMPSTQMSAAIFLTKSQRVKFYIAKAKLFRELGEAILKRELVLNASNLKFEEAAYYYYCASMGYRAASRWRDAGECMASCGSICERMKRHVEAAVFYTEASDAFFKVDKSESIKNLDMAVSIYCDTGRFDAAGRIEREIANIQYSIQEWEEAAEHYQKAADFFIGDLYFSQAYTCLVRQLHCLLEIREYNFASQVCLQIAETCQQTNLRMFNYTYYLFYACLCLLASPPDLDTQSTEVTKYQSVKELMSTFQYKYLLWINSKEALFLVNLIKAREEVDLNSFADHIYYWDNVRPLDQYQIVILKGIYEEIMQDLAVQEKQKRKEQRRKERAELKRAKVKKQQEVLAQKGIDPSTVGLAKQESEDPESPDDSEDEDEQDSKPTGEETAETAGEKKT